MVAARQKGFNMNKWKYVEGVKSYLPHLGDKTPMYMYECDNCKAIVLATPSYTARKYVVSIVNFNYCPHCGKQIVYNKRRTT